MRYARGEGGGNKGGLFGCRPRGDEAISKEAFLERYDRLREELGGTTELTEVREVLMGSLRVVPRVTERAVRGERTLEFE
jgi:hypothetical protein